MCLEAHNMPHAKMHTGIIQGISLVISRSEGANY